MTENVIGKKRQICACAPSSQDINETCPRVSADRSSCHKHWLKYSSENRSVSKTYVQIKVHNLL